MHGRLSLLAGTFYQLFCEASPVDFLCTSKRVHMLIQQHLITQGTALPASCLLYVRIACLDKWVERELGTPEVWIISEWVVKRNGETGV